MAIRDFARKLKEALFESGPPKRYRARPCQGRVWRREFPSAPKAEIRVFLSLFAAAFAYRDREKLKFRPDDTLLEIYRAQYPSKWMADALELETLDIDLERQYGISLSGMWSDDLTLGHLFRAVKSNDA